MRTAVTIALLLTAVSSAQMEKPDLEWVRLYFPDQSSFFKSIIETEDGGFAAAIFVLAETTYSLYRLDCDGNMLWAARSNLFYQEGNVVQELSNGDFIVTGSARETSSSTTSLLLARYDSSGNELWTRLYDSDSTADEEGFSLCQLPDGGFAVCGAIYPSSGYHQAWVLRMDSQGDTLWTREWGVEDKLDRAMTVLYLNEGLTVLMQGKTPSTSSGPHLVRYSLAGDLLWETAVESLAGEGAQSMCEASDGGLLILTYDIPEIAHTNYQGITDWGINVFSLGSEPYGWSVNMTMDGGFVVGAGSEDSYGAISRYSIIQGAEEWWDVVYDYVCTDVHSVRQLSQGGYIAAGKAYPVPGGFPQAILLKYSPETGISEPHPSGTLSLSVSPNPCHSEISASFHLNEPSNASVCLYGLSGRLISLIAKGEFPSGTSAVEWQIPSELPPGCYLIQLMCEDQMISERCVVLR